jgi:hypothetical protein
MIQKRKKKNFRFGFKIFFGILFFICIFVLNHTTVHSLEDTQFTIIPGEDYNNLSWVGDVRRLNTESATGVCPERFIGQVEVGKDQTFAYPITIENSNNFDIIFSCLNCGQGATFTKVNNFMAVLKWETGAVDLSTWASSAGFKMKAEARGAEGNTITTLVGYACVQVVGKCEQKIQQNTCADTSTCVWLPAGKCVSNADTNVKCGEITQSAVCTSLLHCKFENNACMGKNQIDTSEAVRQMISSTHGKPAGYTGPIPDCAFTGECRKIEDLIEVAVKIAEWLFSIIAGLAFVFFVYGGITMIASFGNSEKVMHGKKVLVAAVIGLVITFSAYMLVGFIVKAIGILPGYSLF